MSLNESSTHTVTTSHVTLMGVSFTHVTRAGVMGTIVERIAQQRFEQPLTVFTPNVEQLIQAKSNQQFLKDLTAADVRFPDSVGLVWADWWRSAVTGKLWHIRQRVAGVDMAEKVLREASEHGWNVVLIGGKENVAETAVNNLKKRFSGLHIWSAPSPADVAYESGVEYREALRVINDHEVDVVFVGFGAPKQERWVIHHREDIRAQIYDNGEFVNVDWMIASSASSWFTLSTE